MSAETTNWESADSAQRQQIESAILTGKQFQRIEEARLAVERSDQLLSYWWVQWLPLWLPVIVYPVTLGNKVLFSGSPDLALVDAVSFVALLAGLGIAAQKVRTGALTKKWRIGLSAWYLVVLILRFLGGRLRLWDSAISIELVDPVALLLSVITLFVALRVVANIRRSYIQNASWLEKVT